MFDYLSSSGADVCNLISFYFDLFNFVTILTSSYCIQIGGGSYSSLYSSRGMGGGYLGGRGSSYY